MIAAGHTAIGTIVGATTAALWPSDWPIVAGLLAGFIVGLASHYAMDLLPHGHYNFDPHHTTARHWRSFALDLGVPLFFLIAYLSLVHGWQWGSLFWFVGFATFGAHLPDILLALGSKSLLPPWPLFHHEASFHAWTHWHNPTDPHQATDEGGLPLALPRDLWQLSVFIIALIVVATV